MKKQKVKNIVLSFGSQFIVLLLGFIIPRIILDNYNSDTNGLINTITQIFTYVALLEAGIAQSTTNTLYKYIQKEKIDKKNVSKVLSASHYSFKKASTYYGLIIILLSLFLPLILKTELNYYTVCLYILFEGAASLISFYFVQKWNCLLQVDGKNYIVQTIELITKVLSYGSKIVLSLFGLNIVFIQLLFFIISVIKVLIYKKYINKNYNWVEISKEHKNVKLADRNSYIISELAWTVFSSTDLIILSIFCSTKLSSIYSIYNMVFLALSSLLNSVFNSMKYILGQSFFENKINYHIKHDLFNSIFVGIMTILLCVSYHLIIPFVELYTAGIEDINYIYYYFPIMFCLIQLFSWSRYVSGNLTAIAGYAKYTSYISVAETAINLILSIILVNKYGIAGVLLATVVALPLKVIITNWMSDVLIMKRKVWKTIFIIGGNYLVFFATVIITLFNKITVKSIYEFIGYGIILTIIYIPIVFIVNCLSNKQIIKSIKEIARKKGMN